MGAPSYLVGSIHRLESTLLSQTGVVAIWRSDGTDCDGNVGRLNISCKVDGHHEIQLDIISYFQAVLAATRLATIAGSKLETKEPYMTWPARIHFIIPTAINRWAQTVIYIFVLCLLLGTSILFRLVVQTNPGIQLLSSLRVCGCADAVAFIERLFCPLFFQQAVLFIIFASPSCADVSSLHHKILSPPLMPVSSDRPPMIYHR